MSKKVRIFRWESDKNILLNQVTDYKKQITKLKADLDDVSQSRIHLLGKCNHSSSKKPVTFQISH